MAESAFPFRFNFEGIKACPRCSRQPTLLIRAEHPMFALACVCYKSGWCCQPSQAELEWLYQFDNRHFVLTPCPKCGEVPKIRSVDRVDWGFEEFRKLPHFCYGCKCQETGGAPSEIKAAYYWHTMIAENPVQPGAT